MAVQSVFGDEEANVRAALAEAAKLSADTDVQDWCRAEYNATDGQRRSSGDRFLKRVWREALPRDVPAVRAAEGVLRDAEQRVRDYHRNVNLPTLKKYVVGGAILAARELARSFNKSDTNERVMRADSIATLVLELAKAARLHEAEDKAQERR